MVCQRDHHDGGTSTTLTPFMVVQQTKPTISTITPTSGYRNRTLTVTLVGSGFQVGTGSNVSFYNQSYFDTNATLIYANITKVTASGITAQVFFPDDAPVGLNRLAGQRDHGGRRHQHHELPVLAPGTRADDRYDDTDIRCADGSRQVHARRVELPARPG